MGGEKCDVCARGYLGVAPSCNACGECFENWDQTQKTLTGKLNISLCYKLSVDLESIAY